MTTPLGRLKVVGIIEAISFLVLLGIAMPLKYAAGRPEAVLIVGSAHGALWILYLLAVAEVTWRKQWPSPLALPTWWRWQPTPWVSAALVASVLPAGPLWLDARLAKAAKEF